jgi:digeranylgeranylglycerophospholipid reductase
MKNTNATDWDLVVVGAGFAGAACALAAAQYGLRVCVLERKPDPGTRLHTTGILVKEVVEQTWLQRIPEALVKRVEQVRLYAPNLRSVRLAAPGYYFMTTDTPNLLRWLAGQLQQHGVALRLGQSFTHAHPLPAGVVTRHACPQETVTGWNIPGVGTTRYLVGADGATSRVAQRTGLGRVQDFLYGVEQEFDGATLPEGGALHCFASRRFAPGYIGWAAQNPTGVQVGLAVRHDPAAARQPEMDRFLRHVGDVIGLPLAAVDATRAGLIPCGPVRGAIASPGVILTGDAAGVVSPLSAGGIHTSWRHGWTVGDAIALHVRGRGPAPEGGATAAVPTFRRKRALRWAMDHLQLDWPLDLLLQSRLVRRAAEQVYFHRRGLRMDR